MASLSSRTALVGRDDAMTMLRRMAADADDFPVIALIAGEAGIGKTCLVDYFGREMINRKGLVLTGGCVELAGDSIPYAPLAEILRRVGHTPGTEAALTARARADLDHLLGVQRGEQPEGRAELYDRALRLLEALVHGSRDVTLILEDLHWADQGTLDLVAFLARNLPPRLLLILTYRSDELGSRAALQALLGVIARDRRTRRIDLSPLTKAELATIAESARGRPVTGAELEHLFVRSEGNPFIAEELLVADEEGFAWTLDDVLLARAARLGRDAEEVMRLVAVVGRTVSHDDLAAAAVMGEESLSAALRQVIESGLLTVDGDRELYRFRHVLTQEAVLRRLMPGERRRLHATIAAAIEAQPGTHRSASRAAECAAHWYRSGDHRAALASAITAGRLAASVHAYTDALRQFGRALELFDWVEDGEAASGLSRLDLMMKVAAAASWTGAAEFAIATAQGALQLATTAVDQGQVCERIGHYHWDAGRNHDAEEAFERAHVLLAGSPPTALTANIAASRAHFLLLSGNYEAAIPAARGAVELAIAAGAKAAEGRARITLGLSLVFAGTLDEGADLVQHGHQLITQSGNLDDLRRADGNLSYALVMAGRTAEACDVAVTGLARIRRYGLDPAAGSSLTANTIVLLRIAGRWDEAERLIDEVVADELPPGQVPYLHLGRAELEIARGNLDLAREHLDRAGELAIGKDAVTLATDLHLAESQLALEYRDLDSARERIQRASEELPDGAPARFIVLVCRLALRIEADIEEQARWTHRPPTAPKSARTAMLAKVRQAQRDSPSPEVDAIAATAEAEFSRSQLENDPEFWQHASTAWKRLSRPYELAYCSFRWAEAELNARRPTFADAAARALKASHDIAVKLGATAIQRDTEDLARRSRIDLNPAPAAQPRPTTPAAELGLTPREMDVLQALALGHTNREIANQLFLSHRTVAVHVSNLLSKLGVSNRGQAAAAAIRLQLLRNPGEK